MGEQRSRTGMARALGSLAALLLAAGCGMYGDLYVEEPASQAPAELEERAPIAAPGVDPAAAPAEDGDKEAEKPGTTPPDGAGSDVAGPP